MPEFDERGYEDRILKPLRGAKGALPGDLESRYAVEPGMDDDAALRARVTAVVHAWNKRVSRPGAMGTIVQRLLDDHARLHREEGDPASAAFWQRYREGRATAVEPAVTEVAESLVYLYGPLGIITDRQLRAVAAGHTVLGAADLDRARAEAGLRVVEPVELPVSGPQRGRAGTLTEALAGAGVPGVAHLLVPGLTTFRILDGLVATRPGGDVVVTADLVDRRMIEVDRLADSPVVRSQKVAVGFLATELRGGADLARMALFHLLEPLRAHRAEGAPPHVLFRTMTASGLDADQAALIAVSVFAESSTPARDPAALVRGLLGDGRLVAAEQQAAAVPGDPGDAVRAEAAAVRERVEGLRQKATKRLRAGREDEAASLLRQALGFASDLPALAEELRGIPATPVLEVTAAPDGAAVRISWRPAPDHGDDTEYRVVRGSGRLPADPDDGAAVTGAGLVVVDDSAPVAVPVPYAVFAREGDRRWSRPGPVTTAQLLPPVTDLRIEGDEKAVTGRWKVHPDACAVDVMRESELGGHGDETVRVTVDRLTSFRDTTAVAGVRYRYTLVVRYRPGDGEELRSAPVTGSGAIRIAARPISSLTARPAGSGTRVVRLSWRTMTGADVIVRRADSPCSWSYGESIPLSAVVGWGHELDGERSEQGSSTVLVAAAPAGRSYCVAFTVDSDTAVRGADTHVDLVEPVRGLEARRFGDDLRLSWLWPEAAVAADVTWSGGSRRISVTQYRSQGGCVLSGVPGVRRVDVVALVLSGGDEARAPGVAVQVEARPPSLAYALRRTGSRFLGGAKVTVTLTAAGPVGEVTVLLVGANGRVMPATPSAGVELLRQKVTIAADGPVALPEIAVPSLLRKPYWLRCFLDGPDGVLLVDPPINQLKVS